MYYIVSEDGRYYAGKSCHDNKTVIWKNHHSRALDFETEEEALIFAKEGCVDFYTVEYNEE